MQINAIKNISFIRCAKNTKKQDELTFQGQNNISIQTVNTIKNKMEFK